MGDPPPLRTLQIVTQDAIGGTELMIVLLTQGMRQRGIHSEVAVLTGDGPISGQIRESGITVHTLSGRSIRVGAAWRLRRLLRSGRFDVVNAYGIKASLIVRVLAVNSPVIVVCGVQGLQVTETEDPNSRKARLALHLDRWLSSLVDAYEANSVGAVKILTEAGIEADKLHYVPNGIDLGRWQLRGAEPSESPPLVLCTARFVPRKRQRDLVMATRRLLDRGLEIRVVFAGDGPTRAEVEQMAGQLGVADRMQFPGSLGAEEIEALSAQAQVFCLVSTWEGMPASLMEAMARGLPAVGTNVNGIADLIEDNVTGLLVPPSNPDALAGALERLLSDRALRRRLGAAARRRIEERHSVDSMVCAKHELYESLIRGAAI